MKNYGKYEFEKRKSKEHHKEHKSQGFRCSHCKQHVYINEYMGTMHRNHCNYCLWSKHVDKIKPGDRLETCHAGMKPIGLTYKNEGYDRYGQERRGELKIIHQCVNDLHVSTNRIAADDDTDEIFKILNNSSSLSSKTINQLRNEGIILLDRNSKEELTIQLFGK